MRRYKVKYYISGIKRERKIEGNNVVDALINLKKKYQDFLTVSQIEIEEIG